MTLPFIIAALGAGLICFLLGRRSASTIGDFAAGYRLGRRVSSWRVNRGGWGLVRRVEGRAD